MAFRDTSIDGDQEKRWSRRAAEPMDGGTVLSPMACRTLTERLPYLGR